MKIKPDVNSKGARSGHPERYDPRAEVKKMAKKARRRIDKTASQEG
jgi:hypothetical protein